MAKVKCPKCDFINAEGQDQCVQCATPLPRIKMAPLAGPKPPQKDSPASAAVEFRPGQTVAGRYTVINMIGRGGMGCIYRVRDNVLKEDVALKTLLPQFVRDRLIVERFFNEARIARGLSHPNVVRVHDIGMTEGIVYISMELIRGQSLRGLLEGLPSGQRLPIEMTLHIVDELCGALDYAHRHTVHRDIKPENVMVCADGTVKLMDFGISKLMDTRGLTGTSIVMGTPFYMSPEQLRNSASVDARADIYSVGVMLYEILTGNMPTGVPKPASQLMREVPPALDPIVAKCVDPDPNKRYQSATELRAALRPIRELIETQSDEALVGEMAAAEDKRRVRASRVRRAAGVVLMLLLVAMTGAGLYTLEGARKEQASLRPAVNVPPRPGVLAPASTPAPAATAAAAAAQRNAEFERLKRLAMAAKSKGKDALAAADEARRNAFNDADALWTNVEIEYAKGSPHALDMARDALQCFLAVVVWPENMVFVPPGNVALGQEAEGSGVFVDGFFIDKTVVTNTEFLQFCQTSGWRNGRHASSLSQDPDSPVTDVTYYDAQAYAAWAGPQLSLPGDIPWARKRLPTEAQWARAAYADRKASDKYPGGDSWETGYVAEWTRSASKPLPYDPDDGRENEAKFWFGTEMIVRGAYYAESVPADINRRAAFPFEAAGPTLGFRCVFEPPSDPDEIEPYESMVLEK